MSRRAAAFLAGLVLLALAGCALLTAPRKILQTQFFVLDAVAPATGVETNISIGLGPISLPNYLDRPEMARRRGRQPDRLRSSGALGGAAGGATSSARSRPNLVQIINPQRILSSPGTRNAASTTSSPSPRRRFEQQPDGNHAPGGALGGPRQPRRDRSRCETTSLHPTGRNAGAERRGTQRARRRPQPGDRGADPPSPARMTGSERTQPRAHPGAPSRSDWPPAAFAGRRNRARPTSSMSTNTSVAATEPAIGSIVGIGNTHTGEPPPPASAHRRTARRRAPARRPRRRARRSPRRWRSRWSTRR